MDSTEMPTEVYEEDLEFQPQPLRIPSRSPTPRGTEIGSSQRSTIYFPTAVEEDLFMCESEYTALIGKTSEMSEGCYEFEAETEKSLRSRRKTFDHLNYPDKAIHLTTDERSLVMPTEMDDFLMFIDDLSDSEDSIHTYVQSDYETPPDFFEDLGDVPDLDQLSKDDLLGSKRTQEKPKSGRFVDPLTGEWVDIEPELLDEKREAELEDTQFFTEDIEPLYEEFSFENYDAKYPIEKPPEAGEVDGGEIFTMVHPRHMEKIDFDAGTTKKVPVANISIQTKKFLDDLIIHVIHTCENVERVNELRDTLDKKQIFQKICRTLKELTTEMTVRNFLTRKAAEYYRRKRTLRFMIEEKPERRQEEKEAYDKKLEYLNSLLGREVATKEINTKNITKCTKQFKEMEKHTKETIETFENMIKRTLHRDSMPNLMLIIQKELKHMTQLREEISQVRSKIIRQQHVLGTLETQLQRLENIGNGLSLGDYDNLHRTTVTLDKKIEYRNKELHRAFRRFQHDLHVVTHSRMESDLMIRRMALKINTLKDYEDMEYMVRKQVHTLTMKRKRIRWQLNDLNESHGLLDKPALLRDYDETVERLEAQRKKVASSRATKADLEERLRKAQTNPSLPKPKSVINKSKNLKPNLEFKGS